MVSQVSVHHTAPPHIRELICGCSGPEKLEAVADKIAELAE